MRVSAPAVIAACLLASLLAAFGIGVERHLHASFADQSYGRVQFAVGSAITSMKYGYRGYTIAEPVRKALEQAGLTGDPVVLKNLAVQFPDNLRDPALINRAIEKAAELRADPAQSVQQFGNGGEDMGLVDFARISFALFGFRVESFYYFYFLVLAISFGCAAAAFREQPGVLASFVALALALPPLFASSILDFDVDGILDPRFLSTLAVVPAMHLALAALTRQPRTRLFISLAACQACILVFAYWTRSSALWAVLALFALAAPLAIGPGARRREYLRTLWPVGLLLALMGAHVVYAAISLHGIYRTGNERPYHALWHAVVSGLQVHPEWKAKYGARFEHAEFDEVSGAVAREYLRRHPPKNPDAVYLTADRKHLRIGAAESATRKAFFDFFISDPVFVLETFFIYNASQTFKALSHHLSSLTRVPWQAALPGALIAAALALHLAMDRGRLVAFALCSVLLTAAFAASLGYLLLTAPNILVVADQLFLVIAVACAWLVVAIAAAVHTFLRPVRN
jgi:hypothetical protein